MAYKNEQNIRAAIAFFKAQGYHDEFIAGMLGNIATESANTFDPKVVQHSYLKKDGYGIASYDDYVQRVDNGTWHDPKGNTFETDRIGFGLTQLTSAGRKTGYLNYARSKGKSIGDLTTQLEWIVIEIGSTGYANVRKALKEKWGIAECARVICTDFERPAKKDDAAVQQNRINHAMQIYDDFFKNEVKEETNKPMKKVKIMLDAGHDGYRNQSPVYPQYYESVFNWKLQNYLKPELEKYGFEVGVTRNTLDTKMDVVPRGKKAKGYDLFISLHSNACGTESVDRVVGIFLAKDNTTGIDEQSEKVAVLLANTVKNVMGLTQVKTYYKLAGYDRNGNGITTDDEYYGVLHGSHMVGTAGIILEHSFHTNLKAAQWLYKDENIKALAVAEAAALAEFYGMKKEDNVPIVTPKEPVEEPVTYTIIYKVVKGDTLSKIATKYNTTVDEILALNPSILNKNLIRVGDEITIPVNSAEEIVEEIPTYVVKAGDNLSKIAKNLTLARTPITWIELAKINGISFPYNIIPGQVLVLK